MTEPVAPTASARWRRRWVWLGCLVASTVLLASVMTVVGPLSPVQKVGAVTLTGCNAAANPIVCENSQPGYPEGDWMINEPGDMSIQGFATDQSVDIGSTISFKVDTNATNYSIQIIRLGWYGGDGGRLLDTINVSLTKAQTQPACLVDNTDTTGLIDCGNWAVSASWTVPPDAVSGMYVARLQRNDTGGASFIQFVVRNDASHSDIVYQTSDVTREAYNRYGGNSLYVCTVACPPGNPEDYKAAYMVSFNRPNIAAALGGPWSFFDAEYPMVEYLEQNGYNVSYISGVDTDRYGSLLTNHKIFISSGHDEYWSAAQRSNVTSALAAGVNLAFFSGNEIFWKVRYQNSTDGSNTPYRTLVTYKETHFNAPVDPQDPPTWTGAWRDGRYSPPADATQPENALSGQMYMVDQPDEFTMQVPSAYSKLRFWRNTSVASLASGQTASLAPNSIGYEWDEDVDNGFRPAGEFDMSSTTENVNVLVLDYYAEVTGPGVATHHLTMYRASSGALVFDAGTVQWAYGLEPNGNSTVSPAMQQATINLFADMGVQPGSIMSGMVAATASTDHTPPVSTVSSPSAGSTVANGTTVTVTGSATDSGGGVVAGVEVSTDGGSTWHPATIATASTSTTWSYKWNVTGDGSVTIKSRAADDSGNIETPGAGVGVTVNCPCQLFANSAVPTTPDGGDGNAAELGVKFETTQSGYITGVRFYKASTNTGTHVGSLWSSTGTLLAQATFTSETASGWQQVQFSQAVPVTAGTVYVASYHTNSGHAATDEGIFSGRTVSSPPLVALESATDTSATQYVSGPNGIYAYSSTPTFPTNGFDDSNYYVDVTFVPGNGGPTVTGVTPAPGSTGQAVGTVMTATFSEAVQSSSIKFSVTGPGSTAVAGAVSYNSSTNQATFTPSAPLAAGTSYTATVSGATDAQNRTMLAPYSWSFQTAASTTCPCTLFSPSSVPANVDANDGSSVEVGVKFSSNENGFITGVRFYKGPSNTGTHVGSLWSSSGTLLAQGTFTGETASGWQQLNFASSVAVTAGTTYVVSYHAPNGNYPYDTGYFSGAAVTNGPLTAPGGGANGLYVYSSGPTFPTNTYQGDNFWVDPVFNTTGGSGGGGTAPTVTTVSPAANATGVAVGTSVSATFSEAVQSVSMTVTGPGGTAVAGTLSYNSSSNTETLTPSAALSAGTSYTATVQSATDSSGHTLAAPYSWSFQTAPATTTNCPCTLWSAGTAPSSPQSNDGTAVEVGTVFSSSVAGYVTGVEFYKGSKNTGTHVGNLWSSTGQLLATGTFTGETASGWQTLNFSTPVAITANTNYIVSYHTNTGYYSFSAYYFNSAYSNAPLTAPAGNNGVFSIGSASAYPTQTYESANFWVQPIFNTSP